MTKKRRIIDQINHRPTEYIPMGDLDFEGDVAERLDGYYGNTRWRTLLEENRHIIRSVPEFSGGVARYGRHTDMNAPRFRDVFGITWRTDLRPMHVVDTPLKEPSLEDYRFPQVSDLVQDDWEGKALEDISRHQDSFVINGIGNGIFQRTWHMRGLENSLSDSILEPRFYQELIEKNVELYLDFLDVILAVPTDGVMFTDDWGDQRGIMLGPDRWRRFIKPYQAMVYEKVHKAGKFTLHHSCGNVQDIIPDLIEIGLDVLQSVQPEAMDPYELKREYGKEITFWGGLGSQRIVPFGRPDEIRSEVSRLCQVMGDGGGYILGPAKPMQPETPTENAAAVVEAFLKEQGVSL